MHAPYPTLPPRYQRVESSIGPITSTDVDGRWVQCETCHKWHHWVCAMFDDTQYANGRPYHCPSCKSHEKVTEQVSQVAPPSRSHMSMSMLHVHAGRSLPTHPQHGTQVSEAALNNDAVNLTGIPMSDFIERVHAFTPRTRCVGAVMTSPDACWRGYVRRRWRRT